MLKKRLSREVCMELHNERINASGVSVVVKDVREAAADEEKVACDKVRHIVADDSISTAPAHKCELQFWMKMPWRTIVIALYVLAENALLLPPWDLFANGEPLHVIKVSVRKPAGEQKSQPSLGERVMSLSCRSLYGSFN
jgi:hypothetical protein